MERINRPIPAYNIKEALPKRERLITLFYIACLLSGVYLLIPLVHSLNSHSVIPFTENIRHHISVIGMVFSITFAFPISLSVLQIVGELFGTFIICALVGWLTISKIHGFDRPIKLLTDAVKITSWHELQTSLHPAVFHHETVSLNDKLIHQLQSIIDSKRQVQIRTTSFYPSSHPTLDLPQLNTN